MTPRRRSEPTRIPWVVMSPTEAAALLGLEDWEARQLWSAYGCDQGVTLVVLKDPETIN